jgi:hypothetical protein
VLVDVALVALGDLRAAYRRFVATSPQSRPVVTPLLAHLQRHETDLRQARSRLTPGVSVESPQPRPSGVLGRGVASVLRAERQASRTCLTGARTAAHPEVARLLAQTAASHAQHAALLTRAVM